MGDVLGSFFRLISPIRNVAHLCLAEMLPGPLIYSGTLGPSHHTDVPQPFVEILKQKLGLGNWDEATQSRSGWREASGFTLPGPPQR